MATSMRGQPDGVATSSSTGPRCATRSTSRWSRRCTASSTTWARRDDVRAWCSRGAGGKAFAGGADIAELRERTPPRGVLRRQPHAVPEAGGFSPADDRGDRGLCAGRRPRAGAGAAICAWRRRAAKVGLPEVDAGHLPGGGRHLAAAAVGGAGPREGLVFTGRILEAAEATQLGPLRAARREPTRWPRRSSWPREIAANAPLAVQVAKVSLNTLARGEATRRGRAARPGAAVRLAREARADDGVSREANEEVAGLCRCYRPPAVQRERTQP